MHTSRTPLLACACLLAVNTAAAFVPPTRPFGTPSRLLSSLREDDEDGAAAPRHEPRDLSRPQSECVGGAPGRVSPPSFHLHDDLQLMRRDVAEMEVRYDEALQLGLFETASYLRERITEGRGRDAERVYSEATCAMYEARAEGDDGRARRCRDLKETARMSMPQFNLHGLWVGKYGTAHEMINITYSGDTLVATKVTGDRHVPRGQTSFTVDLRPLPHDDPDALSPVELTGAAATRWGVRMLARFLGRGQVAEGNFRERAWVEGQLVLIGDYFSFAWVPQKHQIFFVRPSAEQAVRMLRDHLSEEDEVEQARAAAERMYRGTAEGAVGAEEHVRRIARQSDLVDLQNQKSAGKFQRSKTRIPSPILTRLQNRSQNRSRRRQSRNFLGRAVRLQLKRRMHWR